MFFKKKKKPSLKEKLNKITEKKEMMYLSFKKDVMKGLNNRINQKILHIRRNHRIRTRHEIIDEFGNIVLLDFGQYLFELDNDIVLDINIHKDDDVKNKILYFFHDHGIETYVDEINNKCIYFIL